MSRTRLMLPLANLVSDLLPGIGLNRLAIAGTERTYAPWKVWNNSTTAKVRFAPLSKRQCVRLYHKARDFERQTRQRGRQDGALGQCGLRVLHTVLFDIIDYRTGRLDPSQATIARRAGMSERSVARGLANLKAAGVLNWLRRARESVDKLGRFCLVQATNAYAVLPWTQWLGFIDKRPEAPPPAPGTWGDHPPLPDVVTQAADEMRHGAHRTALSLLECDPGDPLARQLASFGRSIGALEASKS